MKKYFSYENIFTFWSCDLSIGLVVIYNVLGMYSPFS